MCIKNFHFPCIDGILPKGPYPACIRVADRALLAGYPRYMVCTFVATSRPELDNQDFENNTFDSFFNYTVSILFQSHWILLLRVHLTSRPAKVRVMAWRWSGIKSLLNPMMIQIDDTIWYHKATTSYSIYDTSVVHKQQRLWLLGITNRYITAKQSEERKWWNLTLTKNVGNCISI